jgi:hypothetical protein
MPKETPETQVPDVAAAAASLVFTRAPDYRVIFSDFNRSRVGNGSVTITFSKQTHTPSLQANPNIIEEQAEVTLSWIQFKIMILNFTSILSAIETEIGSIPLPKVFKIDDEKNRQVVRSLGISQR